MSSGAVMPALAPASIDMLQIVIRSFIVICVMVEPAYSIA